MARSLYSNSAPPDLTGSWYNTGFHGHYRSRPRTDFAIPFRQRVKPAPPQKFLNYSKERSNSHLFSRHDNRNTHSDMGDLETFFGMGLGKRKYTRASAGIATQHTKSTQDLITWRGNENDSMVSTYRTHFEKNPAITPIINETEPVHIRSNLNLRRRQLRAASAPPTRQAPPLLAWNEPDEAFYAKPGVGLRPQSSFVRQGQATASPFAATGNTEYGLVARPKSSLALQESTTSASDITESTPNSKSFTLLETITPLKTV
ncbi:uncharacterized protein LOC5514453 [Nematostella vectensis]|uniref:uncharacterized protein LOC5514453 n=1 Tax=Nematostella vectensis TaxID=45351 RepID=UPI002076EC87|nr:uncharacterized protein LOC5514453 [Nematostella vectensis]